MLSLPNLSGLHIGHGACQPCKPATPIGEVYDDIYAARNYDDEDAPGCPKKTQERGGGWDEDDATCSICLELLRRPAELDLQRWDPSLSPAELLQIQALCEDPVCGHAFHAQCLYRYIMNGGLNCPICRTEINVVVQQRAQIEDMEYDERREQFLNRPGNEELREAYRATLSQNQDAEEELEEDDVEDEEEEEEELDPDEAEHLEYLSDGYIEERDTPNLIVQFYPAQLQDLFRLYRTLVNEHEWNTFAHKAFKILRTMMNDRFVGEAQIDEMGSGRVERFEDLYFSLYPGSADERWRAFLYTAVQRMANEQPAWLDAFTAVLT